MVNTAPLYLHVERDKSIPSIEVAEKMVDVLNISLDELVYSKQNENARTRITHKELNKLFNKPQNLEDDLKNSAVDFLDTFILKHGLRKQLA